VLQARTADELAHRLERAGDLTLDELAAREAPDSGALRALLASGRAVKAPVGPHDAERLILAEYGAQYAVARSADSATARAARREILARYLALAGLVGADEVTARYPFSRDWIQARLTEWERTGTLVRAGGRWISRRVMERARRRALAKLRAEIQATDLPTFVAFLQRWQHVDPRDRLDEEAGLALIMEQLDGLARPADAWERDYLPSRMTRYDSAWLSRAAGSGALVWAGVPPTRVRFFVRGEGALWHSDTPTPSLSESAERVRDALVRGGASFLSDVTAATGLGALVVRDALRELATAGLVTNDTVDAMREVMHQRALPSRARRDQPDPTRWLPSTFTAQRPIVQRRVNPRSLPRWQRPDRPQRTSAGRWSMLDTPGTRGPALDEDERAAAIAQKWLVRYGIVTRDWWRRERPSVSWRAIYRELKRLELRGEVRRGYFVEGLAGAQFALPEAVERLRAAREDPDAPLVAMAANDPAYPDVLPRPRGASALLITRRGAPAVTVEGNGRSVTFLAGLSEAELSVAVSLIAVRRGGRRRTLETIDGHPAATSVHAPAFARAGFRLSGLGLDFP
jgi:ATP-dependent helicase Lhr and Lhr-like helicase